MIDETDVSEVSTSGLALGHAHRRVRVFLFWWLGIIIAFPGAVYSAVQVATGQDPETGLGITVVGLVVSAVGWLAGLGMRYTKKMPRPASDVSRVEREIRVAKGAAITIPVLMLVIVIALMTLAPNGTSPGVLPVLGFLAAFPFPIAGALLYSRLHLLARREELFGQWLARNNLSL